MKKNYSIIIIILISLCAISASPAKKTFTAWIIQDDQKVEVNFFDTDSKDEYEVEEINKDLFLVFVSTKGIPCRTKSD